MNPDTLNSIYDILELSQETRDSYAQKMDAFIVEKGIEAFLESLPHEKKDKLLAQLELLDVTDADLMKLATKHLTPEEMSEAQEALARGMEMGYVDFLNVLMSAASDAQKKQIEALM